MNTEKIICFEERGKKKEMFLANINFELENNSRFHPNPVSSEKFFSFGRFPGKSQINDLPRSFTLSFKQNQDPREFLWGCNSQESDLSNSSHLQQKQSSRVSSSKKTRIKWTEDLHDKFVESVNRLGGAEKATPMGILKLMGPYSKGLTVIQVKSHLQKYRINEHLPDTSGGKSKKKGTAEELSTQHDSKTEMEFKDALQLQLDIQRHLCEQLEIQRNLQLRIEEQGRELKMMLEQQQKAKKRHIMPRFDYSSPFTIEEIEDFFPDCYGNNPR